MSDAKSYVIGIIEIDPIAECQQSWVTLAGDDDTLDAVLARLAGRAQPHGPEPDSAVDDGRHKTMHRNPSPAFASPERVAANLTELSADLAVRLAEIRGLLTAAGAS